MQINKITLLRETQLDNFEPRSASKNECYDVATKHSNVDDLCQFFPIESHNQINYPIRDVLFNSNLNVLSLTNDPKMDVLCATFGYFDNN